MECGMEWNHVHLNNYSYSYVTRTPPIHSMYVDKATLIICRECQSDQTIVLSLDGYKFCHMVSSGSLQANLNGRYSLYRFLSTL